MARLKEGQTILAYAAAGGAGTAVIQLAKLAAVKVIGLTSTDPKADFARAQGYDPIINDKVEDMVKRVKEITGGKGVDIILNSAAGDTFGRIPLSEASRAHELLENGTVQGKLILKP
jgi:NADPH2:quinone reductase